MTQRRSSYESNLQGKRSVVTNSNGVDNNVTQMLPRKNSLRESLEEASGQKNLGKHHHHHPHPSESSSTSSSATSHQNESDRSFPLLKNLGRFSLRSSEIGSTARSSDALPPGRVTDRPNINAAKMYSDRKKFADDYPFLKNEEVANISSSPIYQNVNELSEYREIAGKEFTSVNVDRRKSFVDLRRDVSPKKLVSSHSFRASNDDDYIKKYGKVKVETRRKLGDMSANLSLTEQRITSEVDMRNKVLPKINIIRASGDYGEHPSRGDYSFREKINHPPIAPAEIIRKPAHGVAKPINPEQALVLAGNYLTKYELMEVKKFSEIYFTGMHSKKIHASDYESGNGFKNFGYDDSDDSYRAVLHDHLLYRYQITGILGKGSFCTMIKAFDHKRKRFVAVKIIRNNQQYISLIHEEIKILQHLRKVDTASTGNVVHILGHFIFRNHHCLVFELLHLSLYDCLKKRMYRGLSLDRVARMTLDILDCLILLSHLGIIHCDLKPENILLLNEHSDRVKVIDFGSSCYENQRVYTYIQSRFYRAPEVILGAKYGMAIDMWSLGCILCELLTGHPLLPGEDEGDQLACIMEMNGMPPYKLIEQSKRVRNFITSKGLPRYCTTRTLPDGSTMLQGGHSRRGKPRGPPGSKSLQMALKGCNDPLFLDFIKRCLEWDPAQRITPNMALKHSWLRRRLPKPPLDKATDSASSSNTLRNTPSSSSSSRNSSSSNTKLNTIASSATKLRATITEDSALHGSRHHHSSSSTKLPQISNTAS